MLRLFSLWQLVGALAKEPQTCGAKGGQGKCGFDDGTGTYQSKETGRGAGKVPLCGDWCGDKDLDPNAPCAMDKTKMACSGEYWCTTTCSLWNMSILAAQTSVTCEQFIRTSAFPRGGEVCREDCLLAEIRPQRYPAPTGLGFLCAPGTCDPAVQSRYNASKTGLGLGVLECPCNWFGSDCNNDWVPIQAVVRKEILGDFMIIVFKVDEADWHLVMQDHRPGGVVRVQRPSYSAWGQRPLEQPYALANDKKSGVVGELEVLAGKPEAEYFETVTEVARHVRSLPEGRVEAPLYINPSIAGFFNKRYVFLMDALDDSITDVILIATGAGLSGVRTAIASMLQRPKTRVHLYYGLRDAQQLPYSALLETWTASMTFTLLVSSLESAAHQRPEKGIQAAIARGEALKSLAGSRLSSPVLPLSGKIYVQHALGLDLVEGALKNTGTSLLNSVVVICGRSELLLDTERILQAACALPQCADLMKERIFMNI